jgi:outer membrane protein assembly factor BamB
VFEKPAEIQYNNISKYLLCNNSLAVTYVDRDDVFEGAGTLVVYDLPSQTVLWQKDYPAGVTGNMACNPDKNRLYVPTEPFLYALDATSGQEVWKYTGFSPIYTPSIANNVVYFISDTNMYALNEDTGEKIFRFAIGETYENTQVAISNGMVYFSSSGGECDMYALGLPEQ